MKKKSLNAKKQNHRILISHYYDHKIKKSLKILKNNILNLKFNDKLAVGVSGGPDSLALAFLLKCCQIQTKKKVYYFHVDHGLRKNSSEEANDIKTKLSKFGIKLKILVWKGPRPKSNIQSEAREIRYKLLFDEISKLKIKNIFLGHNKQDVIENFFIRLTRGSGLSGCVSFNSFLNNFNNIKICRPFLEIEKSDLLYITNKVFGFHISDPSNSNNYFKRARIRKLLNGLESEGFNTKKIKLTINNLSLANDSVLYFVNKNISGNTTLIIDQIVINKIFFDQPEEVVFRSLSLILQKVSGKYYPARGKKVSNLIKDIQNKNFKKSTLSGCIIEKIDNTLMIYKENRKKKSKYA